MSRPTSRSQAPSKPLALLTTQAEVFNNFDQLHELRSLALVCKTWRQLCTTGTWPSVRSCTPQAHHASLLPALRQLHTCPNLTSLHLNLCPALPQAWLQECTASSLQDLNLDGSWHVAAPLPPPLAAHLTALNISGTALPLWGPEQPWATALTTLRSFTANRLQRQPRTAPMQSTLFRQLMHNNTCLHTLSLASNASLTSRHLLPAWAPPPHPSPAPSLRSLSLAGCESFGDGHWAPPACPHLTHLDLSATGISDTQLRTLPLHPDLHHLNLGGCARVTGEGLLALLPLVAASTCRLRVLLLGNMPRVDDARLGHLLATWAANIRWQVAMGQLEAPVVVSLDLAGCGKVSDAVLSALLPSHDVAVASAILNEYQSTPGGLPRPPPHQQQYHQQHQLQQQLQRHTGDPSQRLAAVSARRQRNACGAPVPTPVLGAAGSALAAHYSAEAGGHATAVPDLAARLEAALQLESLGADGTRLQGRPPGLEPTPALALSHGVVQPPATQAGAVGRELAGAGEFAAHPAGPAAGASSLSPCVGATRQPAHTCHNRSSQAATTAPSATPATPATPVAALQLGALQLSCTAISTLAPHAAAGLLAHTHTLNLSHIEDFRIPTPPTSPTPPPLTLLLPHPAPALRSLTLDACHLADPTTTHLGPRCPHLTALSLIGCRGLTNAGLQCFVAACPALAQLAVGGMSPLWQEATALAGLTGLTELRLVRRTATLDRDLVPVLRANPRLQVLTLAGCSSITDAALAFVPKRLRELTLTCCEDVEGRTVAALRRLRLLRISSCPRFSAVSVASAAVSCTRLAVLVLPGHLERGCVPLQAPGGHLDGLRVLGGRTGHNGVGCIH